jgi:Methyltransferase domain
MNPLKIHWETIYQKKLPSEVSWYQVHPKLSLQLIQKTGITLAQPFIEVGGGASVLIDYLLDMGLTELTVLDLSMTALQQMKNRLSHKANNIQWIETDITTFQPPQQYYCWHDRAVFHFLTNAQDRHNYVEVLKSSILPNGYVIIATFATDGPQQCSGLEIVQYDAPKIREELGEEFSLLEVHDEIHLTPTQAEQKFSYFLFNRLN